MSSVRFLHIPNFLHFTYYLISSTTEAFNFDVDNLIMLHILPLLCLVLSFFIRLLIFGTQAIARSDLLAGYQSQSTAVKCTFTLLQSQIFMHCVEAPPNRDRTQRSKFCLSGFIRPKTRFHEQLEF